LSNEKKRNGNGADYIFYLFVDPSCPICENLLKSKAFKRLHRIVAANGTIKIEVYNRADGGIGSLLYKMFDLEGVPLLVDPFTGRHMRIAFRSFAELENLITHQAGLLEKLAKEEKEEKKERRTNKRKVLEAIKKYFPSQWFSPSELREKVQSVPFSSLRRILTELRDEGFLAYDPFEKKYKLMSD